MTSHQSETRDLYSVSAGNAKPSGIAVDWVADQLYWTQVDRSGSKPRGAVVTATTDGRYKRSLIATRESAPSVG